MGLEIEGIDRMYLNPYAPCLQRADGKVWLNATRHSKQQLETQAYPGLSQDVLDPRRDSGVTKNFRHLQPRHGEKIALEQRMTYYRERSPGEVRPIKMTRLHLLIFLLVGLFYFNDPMAQPRVIRVEPEAGSTQVPLYEPALIEIEFDQPMNRTSVIGAIETETDPPLSPFLQAVRVMIIKGLYGWSADGRTLSFVLAGRNDTPTCALRADTEYTITIGTGATDAGGTSLSEPFVWSFRTVPRSVQEEDLEGVVRSAFLKYFRVAIPRPAFIESQSSFPYWTSTAYVGDRLYRIYLLEDGTVFPRSTLRGLTYFDFLPQGTFRVVTLGVDHGNVGLEEAFDTLWVETQTAINLHHSTFAQSEGLDQPLVSFDNLANLLVAPSEIGDPRSLGQVVALLAARGFPRQDYDLVIVLDLDADRLSGGFASPGGFVYMGWFFGSEAREITPSRAEILGFATYHHEVGHHWGWEHEWTGGERVPGSPFITAPSLFGWTDTDGDGVPEILDPTPYGRPDLQPINTPPLVHAGVDQSVWPGSTVVLGGSGSDPDGDSLTFSWTQLQGPQLELVGLETFTLSFTAPDVTAATTLSFQLTVSDGSLSSTDEVEVLVGLPSDLANLIFPQFVNGQISPAGAVVAAVDEPLNRTRIILRNNSFLVDTGRIQFRDGSGSAAAVPIDGILTDTFPYLILPWQILEIETDGTGVLQSGIVEVVSDLGVRSRIEGTEVFEVLGSFVSVNNAPPRTRQQAYVSVTADENTGVALYNPNRTEAVTVDLVLVDGNEQARKRASLGPLEQLVAFVDEEALFGEFLESVEGSFRGTLNVSAAEHGVSVLGLIQKRATGALIEVSTSPAVFIPED